MLKKEMKYEDYDGSQVEEVLYFNLSKPELIEMEVDMDGGLRKFIEKITKEEDNREIIRLFKKLLMQTYGVQESDGTRIRFKKTPELAEAFSQTRAYEILFMELSSNAASAVEFVQNVLPKDMNEEIKAAESQIAAQNQAKTSDVAAVEAQIQAAAAPQNAGLTLPPPAAPPAYIPTADANLG